MSQEGEERFDHGEGLHGSLSFAEIAERNRVLRPQRIRGQVGGLFRPRHWANSCLGESVWIAREPFEELMGRSSI
jgi:hypothetical protein